MKRNETKLYFEKENVDKREEQKNKKERVEEVFFFFILKTNSGRVLIYRASLRWFNSQNLDPPMVKNLDPPMVKNLICNGSTDKNSQI